MSRDGDVLSRLAMTAGLMNPNRPRFSPDGSRIYFFSVLEDGSEGVWWIPANGGDATKVVALDDPSLSLGIYCLTVGPEDLYLTLPEYESDIWVMVLEW